MLEVLDLLIGARELAGAPRYGALRAARRRLAHHRRLERARAVGREPVRLCAGRPFVRDHPQHLRDHVAGALDFHRVADAHVEAGDLVGIVQGRVLHHDAADRDGGELGDRGQRAGAADLDFDRINGSRRLLRRKLVRQRPARAARHKTEPVLPVEPVDLVHDAVNVIAEAGAFLFDLAIGGEQFVERVAEPHQRIDRKAGAGKPAHHAELRWSRHRAHLAPGIGEEPERARGGDGRIELAQRACRRIARIGEHLLARGLLAFVQLEEIGLGHIDLAAHLDDVGDMRTVQPVRNLGDGAHIRGHILALIAIAAGRPAHELPALVAQRA